MIAGAFHSSKLSPKIQSIASTHPPHIPALAPPRPLCKAGQGYLAGSPQGCCKMHPLPPPWVPRKDCVFCSLPLTLYDLPRGVAGEGPASNRFLKGHRFWSFLFREIPILQTRKLRLSFQGL